MDFSCVSSSLLATVVWIAYHGSKSQPKSESTWAWSRLSQVSPSRVLCGRSMHSMSEGSVHPSELRPNATTTQIHLKQVKYMYIKKRRFIGC